VTGRSARLALAATLLLWPGRSGADARRGEVIFQRCYACHSVKLGESGLPGPNLHGVLGRRAGTLPGFEFSPAMLEAGATRGLVWTSETLDAFLADPQQFLPGTSMSLPPLRLPRDRRDVLDFLQQSTSGRARPK
jgi:cytochrome c2